VFSQLVSKIKKRRRKTVLETKTTIQKAFKKEVCLIVYQPQPGWL